jgi:hypothetical protein
MAAFIASERNEFQHTLGPPWHPEPSVGVEQMHTLLSGISASIWSTPYVTYFHAGMAILAFGFLGMVVLGPLL